MCTAITYTTKDHYFGRNLDLEYSYREAVTITPRNFPFSFRHQPEHQQHHAIIGMAYVVEDYPLYYDAINEKGLGMAGLNFPGNARYLEPEKGRENLAPFEFIPRILGQCESVVAAKEALKNIRLVRENFSPELPSTPLHWMIADKNTSIVVEPREEGLRIYDNPVGVLTNNPPFDMQMLWLTNFMGISPEPPQNRLGKTVHLKPYSRGMGGIGLPGDLSSASRFVRAAFVKTNAVSGTGEAESVSQFFHILGSVEQQRGCVRLEEGGYEITRYSSCCNLDKGIYYYTTYENRRITALELHREDIGGNQLVCYPLEEGEQIWYRNRQTT
ncbi:MAG: choloylglycine hydrolase [Clostridia bacterium]|nr:choloylglycine hydrolase [Clostridia bacterium]